MQTSPISTTVIVGGVVVAAAGLLSSILLLRRKFKSARTIDQTASEKKGDTSEKKSDVNRNSRNASRAGNRLSNKVFLKSRGEYVQLEDLIDECSKPLQAISESFQCDPDDLTLNSNAIESLLELKNIIYETITSIDRLFLFYKKGMDFEPTPNEIDLDNQQDASTDYESDDFMSIPDAYQRWALFRDMYHKEEHVRMFNTCIDKYCNIDLYLECAAEYSNSEVIIRNLRTKFTHADNDVDYIIKVLALRKAFDLLMQNSENRQFFLDSSRDLFLRLIAISGRNSSSLESTLNEFIDYALDPTNREDIMVELKDRNLHYFNMYDFAIDFIFVDALSDLEFVPSSILNVLKNRWLSRNIKENSVNTLVWSYIKAKSQMLEKKTGLLGKYYNVCYITSPLLAWGLLGEQGTPLNLACNVFKNEFLVYLRSIFNPEKADYSSIQSLAKSVMDLTRATVKKAFSQIEVIERTVQ